MNEETHNHYCLIDAGGCVALAIAAILCSFFWAAAFSVRDPGQASYQCDCNTESTQAPE